MFARSNQRRSLIALSLVLALLAAASVTMVGCSPSTDDRLVGRWVGQNIDPLTGKPGRTSITYTFREDGNVEVQTSAADTPYPSQWSVLSWEGDLVTIQMLSYQQEWVVRKVKMNGADEFEMRDEVDELVGTFKREAT
ncbi:MAG TPA: hypothetical protein VGN57_13680 [Pirellulaceae bacterium]|jgi:hypothetical protein|nr:hypothetical protein [Pirellulaceae bacterium]